jgi:hypothetical protein
MKHFNTFQINFTRIICAAFFAMTWVVLACQIIEDYMLGRLIVQALLALMCNTTCLIGPLMVLQFNSHSYLVGTLQLVCGTCFSSAG